MDGKFGGDGIGFMETSAGAIPVPTSETQPNSERKICAASKYATHLRNIYDFKDFAFAIILETNTFYIILLISSAFAGYLYLLA